MRDSLVALSIILVYVLSLFSLVSDSRLLVEILPFFALAVLGMVLWLYDSLKEWVFLGGLVFFGYLLSFTPKHPGTEFSVAYLVSFLIFLLALTVFRPRQITGKVLVSDSHWAVVEVQGNMLAGIPKGIYAAKSKKGVKKGDNVLVEVTRKWGERELRILRKL